MTRVLWLVVSTLMALSLAVAACGQAPVKPEVAKPGPVEQQQVKPEAAKPKLIEQEQVKAVNEKKITLTKLDGTKVEITTEKPKYGGTLNVHRPSDLGGGNFDPRLTQTVTMYPTFGYTALLTGDFARGPGGTGETQWDASLVTGDLGLTTGWAAEGYTIVDAETIIFKIRPGIRFATYPESEARRLVGGREMTADDVVYTFQELWGSPSGSFMRSYPDLAMRSVKALDKYTVEYRIPPGVHGIHLNQIAGRLSIMAREVVKKYGDLTDWRNMVGTGAFQISDYVPESSRTYVRNSNYFVTDPWWPDNRLPYVDRFKVLVIPDRSTMLAALRTAKLDYLSVALDWQEAGLFAKTHPDIRQIRILSYSSPVALTGNLAKKGIWGPIDDPNALKVRRALHMAFNKQAVVDNFYGGNAVLFSDPWPPRPEYEGVFRPLETFSPEVQELYQYNPEKAKRLLAEAGYPNGFKAKVVITAGLVDYYAILKADYEKVGVVLEFDVKDSAVYSNLRMARTYQELVNGWNNTAGFPYIGHQLRPEAWGTASNFDHPVVREAFNELQLVLGKDPKRMKELYAKMAEPVLEAAPKVWWPKTYDYYVWWPWLKRYDGMVSPGINRWYVGSAEWVWIDQELKKKLGY